VISLSYEYFAGGKLRQKNSEEEVLCRESRRSM